MAFGRLGKTVTLFNSVAFSNVEIGRIHFNACQELSATIMNAEPEEKSGERPQHWPETQWSIVMDASDTVEEVRHRAVEKLLKAYMPALRAHLILRKRLQPVVADDFLQEFFLKKIVQQNIIERADYSKGKFRSFILRSLENYLRDFFRSKSYRQQAAEVSDVVLAGESGNDKVDVFDEAWAFRVFQQAIECFKVACESQNSNAQWIVYRERMLRPVYSGTQPPSYEEVVQNLNDVSPGQARNLLTSAKRNFNKSLRAVIQQYVEDDALVEDEINQLLRILKDAKEIDGALAEFLKEDHLLDGDAPGEINSIYASHVFMDERFDPDLVKRQAEHWNKILDAPVAEITKGSELDSVEESSEQTVRQALYSSSPDIELLDKIRRFAKRQHTETKDEGTPVFYGLYLLCIAIGIYKCDQLLTQFDHATLRRKFRKACRYVWLDERAIECLQLAEKLV